MAKNSPKIDAIYFDWRHEYIEYTVVFFQGIYFGEFNANRWKEYSGWTPLKSFKHKTKERISSLANCSPRMKVVAKTVIHWDCLYLYKIDGWIGWCCQAKTKNRIRNLWLTNLKTLDFCFFRFGTVRTFVGCESAYLGWRTTKENTNYLGAIWACVYICERCVHGSIFRIFFLLSLQEWI